MTLVVGERSAAASRVAAGMLAPVTETTFTERTLLALNQASSERWPGFADEVVEASGQPSGLRPAPTLSVASDADDAARLRTFADYLDRQGLESERLTSRECRAHEPLLAPTRPQRAARADATGAATTACCSTRSPTAADRAGVRSWSTGSCTASRAATAGSPGSRSPTAPPCATERVVLANGAWAAQVDGRADRSPYARSRVRCCGSTPAGFPGPSLTVRAFSRGNEVYLVPRESGREVVVGATVEEQGFDHRVTAGGVYELLRDARQVIPMTAEYALAETSVGWRPGHARTTRRSSAAARSTG